jgi:hypothetical protein
MRNNVKLDIFLWVSARPFLAPSPALLFVLSLLAAMGLVLLAEQPQGGGAQGTPRPRLVREAISPVRLLPAHRLLVHEGIRAVPLALTVEEGRRCYENRREGIGYESGT